MTGLRTDQRLPDQIVVQFGPQEKLAQFFLEADRAARERGVRLFIQSDFDELAKINARERKNWYRLAPMFDAVYGGIGHDNAFWIVGLNDDDEVVVTQAARLYPWFDTTFREECRSLRLFYGDAKHAMDGERCEVNAPSAQRIKGRVCYSGSTWFRPDYRGRGLASILPRISRSYALTRWMTDYTISLVETDLVDRGVARRYGYTNVETLIQWTDSAWGNIDFTLVWMPREQLLSDLDGFLSSPRRDIAIGA
jgi:hypothetical protein